MINGKEFRLCSLVIQSALVEKVKEAQAHDEKILEIHARIEDGQVVHKRSVNSHGKLLLGGK